MSAANLAQTASFFGSVPAKSLQEFVEQCEERHIAAGELVFQQGEPAETGLLLLEGLFEVSIETDKRVRNVGLVHPGEIVGEQGLFIQGAKRNATVQANKASKVLVIELSLLQEFSHNPAVAVLELHLLATLGRRVRTTNRLIQKAWKASPLPDPEPAPEETAPATLTQRILSFFRSGT